MKMTFFSEMHNIRFVENLKTALCARQFETDFMITESGTEHFATYTENRKTPFYERAFVCIIEDLPTFFYTVKIYAQPSDTF